MHALSRRPLIPSGWRMENHGVSDMISGACQWSTHSEQRKHRVGTQTGSGDQHSGLGVETGAENTGFAGPAGKGCPPHLLTKSLPESAPFVAAGDLGLGVVEAKGGWRLVPCSGLLSSSRTRKSHSG